VVTCPRAAAALAPWSAAPAAGDSSAVSAITTAARAATPAAGARVPAAIGSLNSSQRWLSGRRTLSPVAALQQNMRIAGVAHLVAVTFPTSAGADTRHNLDV
jgi:hypothetical protein